MFFLTGEREGRGDLPPAHTFRAADATHATVVGINGLQLPSPSIRSRATRYYETREPSRLMRVPYIYACARVRVVRKSEIGTLRLYGSSRELSYFRNYGGGVNIYISC